MSGVDEAMRLFDEAYASTMVADPEDKITDFSEKIGEIGYGDCHTALTIFMMHEDARKLFQEKSSGSFAVAVNRVIALAVLAGQSTREQMLIEYGFTKK